MVIVSWLEGGREWQEEKRASVKGHKWDISPLCPLPCTRHGTGSNFASQTACAKKKQGKRIKERKEGEERWACHYRSLCLHWERSSTWTLFPWGPNPFAFLSFSISLPLASSRHTERGAIIRITCSAQLDTSKSAQILIEEISRILAGGESWSHEDVALSPLLIWQSHC